MIQQSSGADDREMYQVFNMGCRLEVYTDEKSADDIISTANSFGIDAQVIGRVEEAEKNELVLTLSGSKIIY
jgi:phosphoribosylformylglycinamidine cyclo-ligase